MKPLARFRNVVLAGGGNRCWWQAGFWNAVAEPGGLAPEHVAGVSAGSSTACMLVAGKTRETLAYYDDITRRNPRNFYPGNWLKGERAFPHAAMYRTALLTILDAEALRVLHGGPEIYVQVARLPAWLGPKSGVLAGILAYQFEKKVRKALHPKLGQRVGFRRDVFRVKDCATPEQLADLILASSCTPPFTPVLRLHGQVALDGGMVDNVPVGALDQAPGGRQGPTLVLLSRRYARPLPVSEEFRYVQPSRPVPIKGWDYTNPEGVRAAYDLGVADGEAFLADLSRNGAPR